MGPGGAIEKEALYLSGIVLALALGLTEGASVIAHRMNPQSFPSTLAGDFRDVGGAIYEAIKAPTDPSAIKSGKVQPSQVRLSFDEIANCFKIEEPSSVKSGETYVVYNDIRYSCPAVR